MAEEEMRYRDVQCRDPAGHQGVRAHFSIGRRQAEAMAEMRAAARGAEVTVHFKDFVTAGFRYTPGTVKGRGGGPSDVRMSGDSFVVSGCGSETVGLPIAGLMRFFGLEPPAAAGALYTAGYRMCAPKRPGLHPGDILNLAVFEVDAAALSLIGSMAAAAGRFGPGAEVSVPDERVVWLKTSVGIGSAELLSSPSLVHVRRRWPRNLDCPRPGQGRLFVSAERIRFTMVREKGGAEFSTVPTPISELGRAPAREAA